MSSTRQAAAQLITDVDRRLRWQTETAARQLKGSWIGLGHAQALSTSAAPLQAGPPSFAPLMPFHLVMDFPLITRKRR